LARARSLRAKFEKWEAEENERNRENQHADELHYSLSSENGDTESIESAKSLRAKFEQQQNQLKSQRESANRKEIRVNRFVVSFSSFL